MRRHYGAMRGPRPHAALPASPAEPPHPWATEMDHPPPALRAFQSEPQVAGPVSLPAHASVGCPQRRGPIARRSLSTSHLRPGSPPPTTASLSQVSSLILPERGPGPSLESHLPHRHG